MEEPTYDTFNFDHWINGYDEPSFPSWKLSMNESGRLQENPIYRQIIDAKNLVFDSYLEIELNSKINELARVLSELIAKDQIQFIKAEIENAKSICFKYPFQNLITRTHPEKLTNINGPFYLELINNRDYIARSKFRKKINDFHQSVVFFLYMRRCEDILNGLSNPAVTEKLENLPHKLCLLYDLGILDLLEDRFSNKSYNGKARETDTARLIATLFEIEKHENVRLALKNKDFLTGKAKSNASQTLRNHGLEPKIFID
ncbi:hypothetical protein [Algoriphagus sanaruensis]|uniref:Uncharacterized protein n=1 Tax=Algoriphagus sanaruensis TaxID=1727163 RepID=A0A142EKG4_9BACT|nr:hypothetical protein [Algoriphagus sanaruensis]AMQ55619.1 hypothetical protein AO498_04325 [Algoriphagus sanaruensis]